MDLVTPIVLGWIALFALSRADSFFRILIFLGIIAFSVFVFSRASTHFYEDVYFRQLCNDAGEHIYKSTGEVKSIYQMRLPEKLGGIRPPPLYATDITDSHLEHWVGERPYWDFSHDPWTAEYPSNFPALQTVAHFGEDASSTKESASFTNYFFEGVAKVEDPANNIFVRITSEFINSKEYCQDNCYFGWFKHQFNTKEVNKVQSRYGYTWAQVSPNYFADRIVGAEWKVIDLETGEVVAEARDYHLFPRWIVHGTSTFGSKDGGGTCKYMFNDESDPTPPYFNVQKFVTSVLEPPILSKKKILEQSKNTK